jgi:hypothetical protein
MNRITICLFSLENNNNFFEEKIILEKNKIIQIKKDFFETAVYFNQVPPEFILSVLLIPDWDRPGNGYSDAEYKKNQLTFMQKINEVFGCEFMIQDFYFGGKLTAAEKNFMNQLYSLSCNDSMMKIRSIINNRNHNHLVIDSNFNIFDYNYFYKTTFAASPSQQMDALNAIYLYPNTLSADINVIYTPSPPNGRIAQALEEIYIKFCEMNYDNVSSWIKGVHSNIIYSEAFNHALENIDLTLSCTVPSWHWHFYRAKLQNNELAYRLVKTMVSKIVTYSEVDSHYNLKPEQYKTLEAISIFKGISVQIGSANCTYEHFDFLIKKYCGLLWDRTEQHSNFVQLKLNENMPSARQTYQNISAEEVDLKIMAQFYNEVFEKYPDKLKFIIDKFKYIMSDMHRDCYDSDLGNILSGKLFNCSLDGLIENPYRLAKEPICRVSDPKSKIKDSSSNRPKLTLTYNFGKEKKSRAHLKPVRYKGPKIKYQGLVGDNLKRAILKDFKMLLEKASTLTELEKVIKKISDSYEYTILATPQRLQLHLMKHSTEATNQDLLMNTAAIIALEHLVTEAKSKISHLIDSETPK